MVFNWEESDDKYTELNSTNEVSLSDIIYGFDCAECGEQVLNDDFHPDPDGPAWHYTCNDCGLQYTVYPTKVKARASDQNI